MPEQHARVSPSSFSRVMLCPASLVFAEQFPNETNQAAEEGTACHEAVERILDGEIVEAGFVAENGIKLTTEHLAAVEEVVEWVLDEEFDRVFLEVRVPVGAAIGLNNPEIMWGTSDIIGIKGSTVKVADGKFGFVPVEAAKVDPETGELEHNKQAMCYLVGALHDIAPRLPGDLDEMWNVILQPRAGGVKQAPVSWADVHKFKEEARSAIALALSDDPPFNPGEEQCRFCPASGSCKAQLTAEFQDLDNVSPDALSDEELAEWLDHADRVIQTAKALQSTALQRLAAGRTIPGWKRTQGSGRAKWADEEMVVAEIEAAGLDLDKYAPRKPTTQTALKAKTALGKDVVEALVVRPPGEPKLVRESAPGDALDGEFEVLD